MREIQRMTFREYNLRIKAWNLRRVDEEYGIALQAWMNREIEAQKKKGKNKYEYVYKSFKEFYDYEKRTKEIIEGVVEETASASTVVGRYAEYLRMKKKNE